MSLVATCDDGSNACVSIMRVGGLKGVSASWLHPGSATGVLSIWGSEPAAGRSLSLCHYALQIKNKH